MMGDCLRWGRITARSFLLRAERWVERGTAVFLMMMAALETFMSAGATCQKAESSRVWICLAARKNPALPRSGRRWASGNMGYTVRRARPLSRRRLSTSRPFLDSMRRMKPWVRARFFLRGCHVRSVFAMWVLYQETWGRQDVGKTTLFPKQTCYTHYSKRSDLCHLLWIV